MVDPVFDVANYRLSVQVVQQIVEPPSYSLSVLS